MSANPHVLVVDDEPDLAELYASWLRDEYTVETAHDGPSALEQFDETVDVVLLDRRMPGVSGDEVLEQIRNRGTDCSVAMITAVDPDFDILELGFDAYLTKPVGETALKDVIDRLLRRSDYTDTLQTFFSKLSKREALMAEKPQFQLDADERYQRLEAEIETLRQQSESHLAELDGEDFEALFYRLDS
ncbi:response regulator [Halobellus captivus]|uniref:response regulator n=1 Tax=Halobellus captivus TaxID=2592614 RepID=UPI0011A5CEDE|nr:response regulator [Halobellus captivus]